MTSAFFFLLAASAMAQSETPVSPESLDSGADSVLPGSGLLLNGFGVATYNFNINTSQNSFGASALAVSLFKNITDNLSAFGQLTASRPAPSPFLGATPDTSLSTDIDNLQLTWVPSSASGLAVTFGKFDSPLAIERDDAPLNYQATSSFTFDYARPVKFTGLMVHDAFSPGFEGWAIVANGWDNDIDNNSAKTAALYGLWSPSLSSHIGLGVIRGGEKDDRSRDQRTTVVATLLFQPTDSWVWGEEIVAGTEPAAALAGGTAKWFADMFFTQYRFTNHWAATLRTDYMDDSGGSRTGTRQVLQSITLSPQYLVGGGFYGIYRNLDRTTLRLPEVSLRLDLRKDRSTEPVFASRRAHLGKRDAYSATFQTVFLF